MERGTIEMERGTIKGEIERERVTIRGDGESNDKGRDKN